MRVLHQGRFGDFDLEAGGCQARPGQGRHDGVGQRAVTELDGRYVDRHAQVRGPPHGLEASLFEHPGAKGNDQAAFLGQRDELDRRHKPTRGVKPPQKRLATRDIPAFGAHIRLEIQGELVATEGGPEVLHDLLSFLQAEISVGREESIGTPARELGAIQRGIGVLQQFFGCVAVGAGERDADAHPDGDVGLLQDEGLGEPIDQPLADGFHLIGTRQVGNQHRELVSSKTGHHVARRDGLEQAARHRDEERVADRVAVPVVHGLEAVEVEAENGQPIVVGHLQGVLEPNLEEGPVRKVRQPVVMRQMGEARFRLLGGGDVCANAAIAREGFVRFDQGSTRYRPPFDTVAGGERNHKVAKAPTLGQKRPQLAMRFIVAGDLRRDQQRVDGIVPDLRRGFIARLLEALRRTPVPVLGIGFPQPVARLLLVILQQQPDHFAVGLEIELAQLVGSEGVVLLNGAAQGRRPTGDEQRHQVQVFEAEPRGEEARADQPHGQDDITHGRGRHRGQDQAAGPHQTRQLTHDDGEGQARGLRQQPRWHTVEDQSHQNGLGDDPVEFGGTPAALG